MSKELRYLLFERAVAAGYCTIYSSYSITEEAIERVLGDMWYSNCVRSKNE